MTPNFYLLAILVVFSLLLHLILNRAEKSGRQVPEKRERTTKHLIVVETDIKAGEPVPLPSDMVISPEPLVYFNGYLLFSEIKGELSLSDIKTCDVQVTPTELSFAHKLKKGDLIQIIQFIALAS